MEGGKAVKSIKEAMHVTEEWRNINGETKKTMAPIFKESELGRAETIVNALKGLTIESAQDLLNRVRIYLLQDIVS